MGKRFSGGSSVGASFPLAGEKSRVNTPLALFEKLSFSASPSARSRLAALANSLRRTAIFSSANTTFRRPSLNSRSVSLSHVPIVLIKHLNAESGSASVNAKKNCPLISFSGSRLPEMGHLDREDP